MAKKTIMTLAALFMLLGCGGGSGSGGSGSGEVPSSYDNITVELNQSEKSAVVDRHNYYRSMAGNSYLTDLTEDLPTLSWDDALAKRAQAWANYLAQHYSENDYNNRNSPHAKEFQADQHNYDTHNDGENIAFLTVGDNDAPYPLVGTKVDLSQQYTGSDLVQIGAGAIDAWASEAYLYHVTYNEPAIGTETHFGEYGHYTQIVWKNTIKVGCGRARSSQKIATVDLVDGNRNKTGTTKSKVDWVVCRYAPAGNVYGQKPY